MTTKTLAEMNRLTARIAATRIQEMLDAGNNDFALRLISVALETIRTMSAEHLEEFLRDPRFIDDERWNALLLTAIRWQLGQSGYPAPAWTLCRPLAEPLFIYDAADLTDAWRERTIRYTPPLFAELNIWCDPSRDFSTA